VLNISVANQCKRYRINCAKVSRSVADILRLIKKPVSTKLEILLVDRKAMAKFNKRFTHRSYDTDVLSFRLSGYGLKRRFDIGQIIISLDMAKANAKRFSVTFEEELARYVVHGILHYFGYDDVTEKKKKRMFAKQEKIVKILCKNS